MVFPILLEDRLVIVINNMLDLKNNINLEKLPQHVAIIMDGNGRWAKSKGKERTFGHKNAINAVRNAINACNEIGIPYLTLYTFSSENWERPSDEVETLMSLLAETIVNEMQDIFNKGLRMHVIGNTKKLPTFVKEQLEKIIELTKNNTKGNLILALSYSSKEEITEAVKSIAEMVKKDELKLNEINESTINQHLYTKDFPDVDLLIRTSGEVRISNFLLWQIAYAELQFLDVLWPDFTKDNFFQSIINFQSKERRYGKTSEQINS